MNYRTAESYTASVRRQQTFSPMDYFFTWTADWYEWDSVAARKRARTDRDAAMKSLRAAGHTVTPFTLSGQRITRGGIGSGHPEIDHVVSVYGFNVA